MARIAGRILQIEQRVQADAFYRLFKSKALASDAGFEYVMIDGAIVKVHRSGQGAKGGLFARPLAALAEE